MSLPRFSDSLRERLHTPGCCCFQSTRNSGTDLSHLFGSQVVRVPYKILTILIFRHKSNPRNP